MSDLGIVVCVHDGASRLPETLGALAAMDRSRVSRIVVIDNASSDGTSGVAEGFARANGGFECWAEPAPGKSAALARFFREAREAYVGVVDDDITVDAGWASAMVERLEASPRAGAVGGVVRNQWLAGPTRLASIYRRSLGDQDLGAEPVVVEEPGGFLMGASMAYRREAVLASGWLEHRLLDCRRGRIVRSGEDAELCIRIRRAGWEVWYEPGARALHRIPGSRQTARALASLRESITASEPWLAWIAGEAMDPMARARRARRLYVKTLLTDWRPTRRRIRLAERRGRARAWEDLIAHLRSHAGSLSPSLRDACPPGRGLAGAGDRARGGGRS